MRTVLPGASVLPSVVETLIRSFDSSEWKVPDVPSAQEPAIVLGWLGSGPSVARPRRSDGPESHEMPAEAHFGALSVASNTAEKAPAAVTLSETAVLCVVAPEVPVT